MRSATTDERERERALDEIRTVYAERLRRREEIDARDAGRERRTQLLRRESYGRALERTGLRPMRDCDVLDVGCQWGTWLSWCREHWGHKGGRLSGIELMEAWVEKGRRLYPQFEIQNGSGDRIPYADASFDVVHQGMVHSSVRSAELRSGISAEMRRVLRPGGHVVWYDFFWNPGNRDTIGMTLEHVRAYFPGWEIRFRERVTLLPPLARRLERVWPAAVNMLSALKFLNFHYIIILRKPA